MSSNATQCTDHQWSNESTSTATRLSIYEHAEAAAALAQQHTLQTTSRGLQGLARTVLDPLEGGRDADTRPYGGAKHKRAAGCDGHRLARPRRRHDHLASQTHATRARRQRHEPRGTHRRTCTHVESPSRHAPHRQPPHAWQSGCHAMTASHGCGNEPTTKRYDTHPKVVRMRQ